MTVYANLVDGELRGVYDLLPERWGDIENFHLKSQVDENFMKENGFVKIIRDTTPFNAETHKMSDFPTYTVENGNVIEHREIYEISPQSNISSTPGQPFLEPTVEPIVEPTQ